MIPVYQTIMATPLEGRTCEDMWAVDPDWQPGNCLQAAVASLCELPLHAVPHFVADRRPGPSQWLAMREWARAELDADFAFCPLEWDYLEAVDALRAEAADPATEFRYVLATGWTCRSTRHVVVWDMAANRMAHDPHPSGAGLEVVDLIEWLCPPYEPAPHMQYADALAEIGGQMSAGS